MATLASCIATLCKKLDEREKELNVQIKNQNNRLKDQNKTIRLLKDSPDAPSTAGVAAVSEKKQAAKLAKQIVKVFKKGIVQWKSELAEIQNLRLKVEAYESRLQTFSKKIEKKQTKKHLQAEKIK